MEYNPDNINLETRFMSFDKLLASIDIGSITSIDAWGEEEQSRLIESIIVRIPLPSIYVDAAGEYRWMVIDGKQRLLAVKRFLCRELRLCGLEYLVSLNGKKYDQIEPRYQRRICETKVLIHSIARGTSLENKHNIIKRVKDVDIRG
jgi:hypothetical protein